MTLMRACCVKSNTSFIMRILKVFWNSCMGLVMPMEIPIGKTS